ncbi:HsdM family class I SAM-dependent methyltransferase [Listeria seeligeri]|uniref:HsdM family class I SAM-dependent methyltransferase n=1 Tax=Listeria seeligeri TaxID=1640 RepID=UPI001887C64F|nr:N-6 DNA methylase [Listeria seeligeri]MBF2641053.1 N-6 DNA methylase [Listeria seeligeri]
MDTHLIKKTGSHYTSTSLSDFMSDKLVNHFKDNEEFQNNKTYKILDPSCGEGELLYSVKNILDREKLEYKLMGMDTNEYAIRHASSRFSNVNTEIVVGDYLELFSKAKENLSTTDSHSYPLEMADMIIANPPYVRTQILGADKAKSLGREFGLKGRVDLYQAFLVAMTRQLKDGGLICVITSNRYLTTVGGKDIRNFLNENYDILEVIDLGDTKLFDAAVLPAIFIGRKKTNKLSLRNDDVPFIRIYEELNNKNNVDYKIEGSVLDILKNNQSGVYKADNGKNYKVTFGYLTIPENPKELWIMASKEDKEWSSRLKENAYCEFGDLFKVKVGIKTTADSVFIKSSEEWSSLSSNLKPEYDVLFPLISSDNISKWKLNNDIIERTKILYTHVSIDGKKRAIDLEKFSNTKNYLLLHYERLSGRPYLANSKSRYWYEIWVPQDPLAFSKLKVVFPDISPAPKFSVDSSKSLVDGNCYWLTPLQTEYEDYLYLACAIGNSKVMQKFHEIEFQNVLYSGRKRYLTQYVKHYLMPNLFCEESQKVISVVKEIMNISDSSLIIKKEKEIEELLLKAFKINEYRKGIQI